MFSAGAYPRGRVDRPKKWTKPRPVNGYAEPPRASSSGRPILTDRQNVDQKGCQAPDMVDWINCVCRPVRSFGTVAWKVHPGRPRRMGFMPRAARSKSFLGRARLLPSRCVDRGFGSAGASPSQNCAALFEARGGCRRRAFGTPGVPAAMPRAVRSETPGRGGDHAIAHADGVGAAGADASFLPARGICCRRSTLSHHR